MSVRYWELKGDPEGRHFCFTTEPHVRCPFADFERERVDGEVVRRIPTPEAERIAEVMGTDVDGAMRVLERGHARVGHHRKRDASGRLTDRCASCGAKLQMLGFSAWVERPKRDDEMEDHDHASKAISQRLGGTGPTVRLKQIAGVKRREAKQWAYEQYLQAKAEVTAG